MTDAVFALDAGDRRREVRLEAYLDPVAEERAQVEAIAWIKNLRHARVDGVPLRRRFSVRGDSLWWFAELYLHKQQVILALFKIIGALEALLDREQPRSVQLISGSRLVRGLAPIFMASRAVAYTGSSGFGRSAALRLAAMEGRGVALNAAALVSRLRMRGAASPTVSPVVLALVHRAFWRADSGDGSAEAYIGPALAALEARLGEGKLAYVSVGPASNFRARRWWHGLRGSALPESVPPIEAYAPLAALAESRRIWKGRHRTRRALWKSADLRTAAVIRECDCWPVVREELAGVAILQWPWSARAMDEAGSTLDALRPAVVVTYAEAGGWGRAIILESRRRGIPSAGLQHGFIYRHWLNYLHEPDEMAADKETIDDRGFPSPTLTLLFDHYVAAHLTEAGRYRPESLAVTGSPRLDALQAEFARLSPAAIEQARSSAGAGTRSLILVTTKHREAKAFLASFLDAAASLPDACVAIKSHPAETPESYADLVSGRSNVTVLSASTPLAPLLAASRLVVTVNSTVALDAAVLGVPSLVIGLPNNLSPFVEAGIMAGVSGHDTAATARAIHQILYDEEFRRGLTLAQRAFLTRFQIAADGHAAGRTADAIVALSTASPTHD